MGTTTLIAILALALTSRAQVPARPASIIAVGDATVSATPDLARVSVGVVTQAATAQDATTQNASQAGAMISALQGVLGAAASIQTISYSLSPIYNNPPVGQSAAIVGYTVTNIVEATVTDLELVGKAIDTAIQGGANRVQGVSFSVQDRTPIIAQALKLAAAHARSQADAIAAGLNIHTGSVLHASEGVNTINPVFAGPVAAAAATPIETGLVIVQASVTLEVAAAP